MLMFKRSVNGHIFRGKNRLVKPVSRQSMATLRKEYEIQESNMLYLRHPYLTLEESSGHAKELNKQEKKLAMWKESKVTMKPNVTIAERLQHLNVNSSWD